MSSNGEGCTIQNVYTNEYIYVSIVLVMICLTIPVVLNMYVARIVYKVRRKMVACMVTALSPNRVGPKVEKRQTRSWKLTIILNSLFLLFWTPFVIVGAYKIYLDEEVCHLIRMLPMCNSGMNALESLILKRNIRQSAILLLTNFPWRWHQLSYHNFDDLQSTSLNCQNRRQCEDLPDIYWETMLYRAAMRFRAYSAASHSYRTNFVSASESTENYAIDPPNHDSVSRDLSDGGDRECAII